jgi:hypothetical protein
MRRYRVCRRDAASAATSAILASNANELTLNAEDGEYGTRRLAAVAVVFLRRVDRFVAMAAGVSAVAGE